MMTPLMADLRETTPGRSNLAAFIEAKRSQLADCALQCFAEILEEVPATSRAHRHLMSGLEHFRNQRFGSAANFFTHARYDMPCNLENARTIVALSVIQAHAFWLHETFSANVRLQLAESAYRNCFDIWLENGQEELLAYHNHVLACMFVLGGNLERAADYFCAAVKYTCQRVYSLDLKQVSERGDDYINCLILARWLAVVGKSEE